MNPEDLRDSKDIIQELNKINNDITLNENAIDNLKETIKTFKDQNNSVYDKIINTLELTINIATDTLFELNVEKEYLSEILEKRGCVG